MIQLATYKTFGKEISFVFEQKSNNRVIESAKAFSPKNIFTIPDHVNYRLVKKSEEIFDKIKNNRDVFKINFGLKYPAHFFYDGVLKELNEGRLDQNKHNIISFIAKTFHMIEFYEQIFEKYKYNALIVSHPTTIRFSTLIWVALNHKIPVFILNYRNTFITIRKLNSLEELNANPEDNPTKIDIKNIPQHNKEKLILLGKEFLKNRFETKLSEIAITTKNKSLTNKMSKLDIIDFLGLSSKKRTIVVFCNCWPDFPNSQGVSHFEDHEDYFNYTLNLAKKMKKYNWIFKAHPAEYMYGKNTTLKKLMHNINVSHIRMIYSEIDWRAVNKIMDCAVTSSGSIGHEYVALGGRAIIARPNSYTNLGFSYFANSKKEYSELLENFENLDLPSTKQKETALIYTALKFGSSSDSKFEEIRFPLGRISYRLWPGLKKFIQNNDMLLKKEIKIIKKFIISKFKNYSAFKYM